MKNVKKIYKSILIILVIISCTDSRDLGFLEEVVLPSNISALFDITQDNSGLVTITPSGEGASTFEIGLGDSSESVRITYGESIENIYKEGSVELNYLAIIAVIFSVIFSYVTIAIFLNFIKKFSIKVFVIYRIILSLILLSVAYL